MTLVKLVTLLNQIKPVQTALPSAFAAILAELSRLVQTRSDPIVTNERDGPSETTETGDYNETNEPICRSNNSDRSENS